MGSGKWTDSPFWNIILLALAWALTLTTSTLLTTVGPLSAQDLGASDDLASFTVGVFLIGAAVSSVPSGWLFRNYGRFWGFTVGCCFQFLGSALGTLAIISNSIGLLYCGCFSIGLAQGLGQFYRFSAVEVTPAHLKSRAVTYVLSGGIIAAFLGPTTASYSVSVIGNDYTGSYMVIAFFAFLNLVVIGLVNFPKPPAQVKLETEHHPLPIDIPHEEIIRNSKEEEEETHTPLGHPITPTKSTENSSSKLQISNQSIHSIQSMSQGSSLKVTIPKLPPANEDDEIRSTWEIVQQPLFILACTIATLAHTIMVMVMSTVSLTMNDQGYSLGKTAIVMELHFFAMFSPGFITGKLIESYGTFMVALIGGFIYVSSSLVLAIDTQYYNYILGMILLGVAWNFAFSAGTVMLTTCYKPKEATEVQAINDFVLFTVAGAGSLISGVVYAQFGWLILIYVSSVLMLIYLLLFGTALVKPRTPKQGALLSDYSIHDNEEYNINDPPMHHTSFSSQKSNSSSSRQPARYADSYVARTINNTTPLTNPITGESDMPPIRKISVSDYLSHSARSLSVSFRVQNEGVNNEIDEFALVRTMSVT